MLLRRLGPTQDFPGLGDAPATNGPSPLVETPIGPGFAAGEESQLHALVG